MINNIKTFFTSAGIRAIQNSLSMSIPVTFTKLDISSSIYNSEPAKLDNIIYTVRKNSQVVLPYVTISPYINNKTSANMCNIVVNLNEIMPIPQKYSDTTGEGWVNPSIVTDLNVLDIGSYAIYGIDPLINEEVVICYASFIFNSFEKVSFLNNKYVGNKTVFNNSLKLSVSDVSTITYEVVNSPLADVPTIKDVYSLPQGFSDNIPRVFFSRSENQLCGLNQDKNWELFGYDYLGETQITSISSSSVVPNVDLTIKISLGTDFFKEILMLSPNKLKNNFYLNIKGEKNSSKSFIFLIDKIYKDSFGSVTLGCVVPDGFYKNHPLSVNDSIGIYYKKECIKNLSATSVIPNSTLKPNIDVILPNLLKTEQVTYSYINQYNGNVTVRFIINPDNAGASVFGYTGEEYTIVIPKTQVSKKHSSITLKSDSENTWIVSSIINCTES